MLEVKQGRYSRHSNPISASLFAQSVRRETVSSSGKDHMKLIEKRFYRHVPLAVRDQYLGIRRINAIIQIDRISVSLQPVNRKKEVSCRHKLSRCDYTWNYFD